jgi:hypothetical protein
MFLPPDVTWSNRPTIVTFGAGACANAAGASSPTMATRQTATAHMRLIHYLLSCGALRETALPEATSPTVAEVQTAGWLYRSALEKVNKKRPISRYSNR